MYVKLFLLIPIATLFKLYSENLLQEFDFKKEVKFQLFGL